MADAFSLGFHLPRARPFALMRSLGCFLLASTLLLPSLAREDFSAPPSVQTAAQKLAELEKLSAKKNAEVSDGDLERLAEKAREIAIGSQDRALNAKARKVEVFSILRLKARNNKIKTDKSIDDYINDSSLPLADRFDVAAYSKNIELSPRNLKTREDVRLARIKNAKFLMRNFPDDERGYGHLIALSARVSGGRDVSLLEEVSKSDRAPARVRMLADKIISQQSFTVYDIKGLDLAAYRGRQFVIYLWSSKNPQILEEIVRMQAGDTPLFVGVNVDSDPLPGKSLVHVLKVPGMHVLDGFKGAVAGQLRELHLGGVYFFEVNGLIGTLPQKFGVLPRVGAVAIGREDGQ